MAAAAVVSALALGFNAPMAPALPRSSAQITHRAALVTMADPWSTGGGGIDMNTVIGGAAALFGTVAGVGLIALTENAGKRNEQTQNEQPCVECKGTKVVTCTICQGTGVDQYADLVSGVKDAVGAADKMESANVVTIEDWDSGPKKVVMYEEILSAYPPKATESVCANCDGRGVVVCDNCGGTGLQPRFLERFSPDDFMD